MAPPQSSLAERYQKLNASFKDCCVFHLGARAGFFSEYNMMILGMMYCLKHRIQFALYSRDATFALRHGWTDYFLPFFAERTEWIHSVFNKRFPKKKPVFWFNRTLCAPILKRLYRFRYFTYDIWPSIWLDDQLMKNGALSFPELGLEGSSDEIRRRLVEATWRFNEPTAAAIQSQARELALPAQYVGIHVRAGDKRKETTLLSPDSYMDQLKAVSTVRDVLVMTDDYAQYEYLLAHYPDWRFYTLEDRSSQGYLHRRFMKESLEVKQKHYLKLLTSMELMSRADVFVGTLTSNIGMFLQIRLPEDRFFSIG
jgi:hypothetical protein